MSFTIYSGTTKEGYYVEQMVENSKDWIWELPKKGFFARLTEVYKNEESDEPMPAIVSFAHAEPFAPLTAIVLEGVMSDYVNDFGSFTEKFDTELEKFKNSFMTKDLYIAKEICHGEQRTIAVSESKEELTSLINERAAQDQTEDDIHGQSTSRIIRTEENGIKTVMVQTDEGYISVYNVSKLEEEKEYLLKIGYTWGDEEPDQSFPNISAAWEAARQYAMNEACVVNREDEEGREVTLVVNEQEHYIELTYNDGEKCRYSIIEK